MAKAKKSNMGIDAVVAAAEAAKAAAVKAQADAVKALDVEIAAVEKRLAELKAQKAKLTGVVSVPAKTKGKEPTDNPFTPHGSYNNKMKKVTTGKMTVGGYARKAKAQKQITTFSFEDAVKRVLSKGQKVKAGDLGKQIFALGYGKTSVSAVQSVRNNCKRGVVVKVDKDKLVSLI